MIKSEQEYKNAMREMILRVQRGENPFVTGDMEEAELLADCIRQGLLNGKTTRIDKNGVERELRTVDGKIHPTLFNHVITQKGLAFLDAFDKSDEERKNEGRKPDEPKSAQNQDNAGKKSLFWTKVGAIATIAGIIASAAVAFIIWWLSQLGPQ